MQKIEKVGCNRGMDFHGETYKAVLCRGMIVFNGFLMVRMPEI